MEARLREKVWCSDIDTDVEENVRRCGPCGMNTNSEPPPSNTRSKLLQEPWEELAMDFMGPLPTGEELLVVINYYSRYYEVKIMKNISAENVIRALQEIFNRLGLPTKNRSQQWAALQQPRV